MNAETEIQQRIRLAMSLIPGVVLWRNSIGFDSKTKVRYGIGGNGGADLIGWYNGRFLAIEVKVFGGNRSPEQVNFIAAVRAAGGLAGFACTVDEARAIVDQP